jgi:phosphate transport system permease protein
MSLEGRNYTRLFREAEELVAKVIMYALTLGVIALMLGIIGVIFTKGLPALNWDMITKAPEGGYYFGKGGGVLNAIAGSLYIAGGGTFMALLIGLPVALALNVTMTGLSRSQTTIRLIMDVLWGIPSIVYGAFGYTIMIFFGYRASLLAGIFTIALLVAPIIVRAMDEALRSVPRGLHEAAASLGANRTEIAYGIFVRQALPGLVSALLLAFCRGIGDAASVLFTAGFTDSIPTSLEHPAATLPLAVFFQLGSHIPEVRERAYAAAVILTLIVLVFSIISRTLTSKGKWSN